MIKYNYKNKWTQSQCQVWSSRFGSGQSQKTVNKQGNTVVYRVSIYLGERANVWNWDRAHSNSKTERGGWCVLKESDSSDSPNISLPGLERRSQKIIPLPVFHFQHSHGCKTQRTNSSAKSHRQKKLISEGLMKNIKGSSSGVTHREKDKFFSIVLSDRKKSQNLLI